MSWKRYIPNLSAVDTAVISDGGGGARGRHRRGFFFSGRIHIQFHMNITPERIRSSYDEMVDMGMKALVEEAVANSGGSAGAGKDWGHGQIRQCAVASGSRHAPSTRLKSVAHDGREREREHEGGHLHSHITRAHTTSTANHRALPSQHRLPVP